MNKIGLAKENWKFFALFQLMAHDFGKQKHQDNEIEYVVQSTKKSLRHF